MKFNSFNSQQLVQRPPALVAVIKSQLRRAVKRTRQKKPKRFSLISERGLWKRWARRSLALLLHTIALHLGILTEDPFTTGSKPSEWRSATSSKTLGGEGGATSSSPDWASPSSMLKNKWAHYPWKAGHIGAACVTSQALRCAKLEMSARYLESAHIKNCGNNGCRKADPHYQVH